MTRIAVTSAVKLNKRDSRGTSRSHSTWNSRCAGNKYSNIKCPNSQGSQKRLADSNLTKEIAMMDGNVGMSFPGSQLLKARPPNVQSEQNSFVKNSGSAVVPA